MLDNTSSHERSSQDTSSQDKESSNSPDFEDMAISSTELRDVHTEDLTVQEKQLRMGQVMHQYIKGKISEQKLEEKLESKEWKKLEVDYAKAALEQASVFAAVCDALRKSLSKLKP